VKTHKENISEMNGLGKKMPITLASFAIAAMGIAGTPPVAGFISKWYLCLGSLEAKEIVFLFVLLTSALFDVAYFFPIIYNSFFREPEHKLETGISEASMFMVVPIAACAVLSILLGIAPNAFFRFFNIASLAARSILGVN
jgi:multicomponent Na+:H+ antiporter subunit D